MGYFIQLFEGSITLLPISSSQKVRSTQESQNVAAEQVHRNEIVSEVEKLLSSKIDQENDIQSYLKLTPRKKEQQYLTAVEKLEPFDSRSDGILKTVGLVQLPDSSTSSIESGTTSRYRVLSSSNNKHISA